MMHAKVLNHKNDCENVLSKILTQSAAAAADPSAGAADPRADANLPNPNPAPVQTQTIIFMHGFLTEASKSKEGTWEISCSVL